MCICLYIFYCPIARTQKFKQNLLHCRLPFVCSHVQYFHILMNSIIGLWYPFWNSSSTCLGFFSVGFESFIQLSLRSYLELHSNSWGPSVQITSNPLVQEDTLKNLGLVWSSILWVGKLCIGWGVALALSVCFTSARLSPTWGMQKPLWNWLYHRLSTLESKGNPLFLVIPS